MQRPKRLKRKRTAKTASFLRFPSCSERLLRQHLGKSLNGLFFILAVRGQSNGHSLRDSHGQNAEETFCVDLPILVFNPNAAFKFISLLNEERCLTIVKAGFALHYIFLRIHGSPPYVLDPRQNYSRLCEKVNLFISILQLLRRFRLRRRRRCGILQHDGDDANAPAPPCEERPFPSHG